MDKQQLVWCGGVNVDQDVSIRLVPNGINEQQVNDLRSREPLAVLKVHSTQLKKHSNYFRACFSERWTHLGAPLSMEFSLELIHGMQVASYTECFSRMYTPLRKNFKDFQSSLDLLRVASQIEFFELVDSVCRYLSTILWSEEDELQIRQFSSSPDFPRSQAEDLVARLEIHKCEYCEKLVRDHIAHNLRIALRQDESVRTGKRFLSARSLFEDLFCSIGQSEIDSAFEEEVVMIVSEEVKERLKSFHEDYRKHATYVNAEGETLESPIKIEDVSDFRRKLKGLFWALELLLKTQVAEEVIKCLLHLEFIWKIIVGAWMDNVKNIERLFSKLVIFMLQEVVTGGLLLGIPDRVLLIEKWPGLECIFEQKREDDVFLMRKFGKALKGVFLTLPLQEQLEVLQRNTLLSQRLTCTKSLITLMKKNWTAKEDALL